MWQQLCPVYMSVPKARREGKGAGWFFILLVKGWSLQTPPDSGGDSGKQSCLGVFPVNPAETLTTLLSLGTS